MILRESTLTLRESTIYSRRINRDTRRINGDSPRINLYTFNLNRRQKRKDNAVKNINS
ncbi:MAG: hypothetical protein LBH04_03540 [Tannerellaceae bacterium]|nr:hypothetical protein [Tannerellaceae bacterium]